MPASSDGVVCVAIPVWLGGDLSSLEVVWPERREGVGRLCYCPPFEGTERLFSRCISTTSCDTDYAITVSNNSVCLADLPPPPASIPLYFTLLEYDATNKYIVRSILTSFTISIAGMLHNMYATIVSSNRHYVMCRYRRYY